jgi:hypothetical protein
MHQIAPPQFSELAQRGGVAWLRRRNVGIVELEGQGDVADAVVVIDALSGRTMAFIGPDFPEGHRLAPINADDVEELAALFDRVDAWFAPRLRGVVASATHAILHGWRTARDARALLSKTPAEVLSDRHGQRFLAFLVTAKMQLAEALDAFRVGSGRPADETRAFFLEELARIALDNGMPLQLPQDRDEREGGVTPFFTFVQACIDVVLSRVGGAALDPAVRRRAASFNWSRIALLHALERIKKKLAKPTL